jgi:integrase
MITFSEFMRRWYAPAFFYGQLKIRTIESYLQSVELYLAHVGDLPLDQLTPHNNARFVQSLNKTGIANETIRKHCRNLNTIFNRMGPSGYRNRDALGLLHEPPWIRPPRPFLKLPRDILDGQVENLFRACSQTPGCFTFPKYLPEELRPKWWETLILFVITTALRHGALCQWTWDDVDFGRRRILISASIDKSRRERIKPLHPVVLQGFRAVQADDRRLLPWPHGNKKFYGIWHEINEVAGIIPGLMLHDLKRYALQRAVRSGIDAATLQLLGDHSSLKTTVDHYVRGNLDRYIESVVLPGMEVVQ